MGQRAPQTDTAHFAQKVAAGADYAITQMLFSAQDYVGLRDRSAAAGADVPILPGIMPVTSYERLMRIIALSGQGVPVALAAQLESVRGDAAAGREIGMAHAVAMCEDLLAAGAPGLHFYTFNRSKATLEVLSALGIARVPALQT